MTLKRTAIALGLSITELMTNAGCVNSSKPFEAIPQSAKDITTERVKEIEEKTLFEGRITVHRDKKPAVTETFNAGNLISLKECSKQKSVIQPILSDKIKKDPTIDVIQIEIPTSTKKGMCAFFSSREMPELNLFK